MPPETKAQFIDNLYRRAEQMGQVIRDILQASEFDTKKFDFADKHLTSINKFWPSLRREIITPPCLVKVTALSTILDTASSR